MRTDDHNIPIMIGVTGHRKMREQDTEAIALSVKSELRKLQANCRNSPLVMLSSLAEGYVDILDDYGTISVMYLMKKARVLGGTREDFAKELAFIADEPLHRLAAFLPDCEPADRQKFENIISAFRTFPGIPDRDSFRPFQ